MGVHHAPTGAGAVPGAGISDAGLHFSVRFLLHAAANARCCVQDLADLRAKALDTVRRQTCLEESSGCWREQSGWPYANGRTTFVQCSQ